MKYVQQKPLFPEISVMARNNRHFETKLKRQSVASRQVHAINVESYKTEIKETNPFRHQSDNASTLSNRDQSVSPQQKQEPPIAYHPRAQSGEFVYQDSFQQMASKTLRDEFCLSVYSPMKGNTRFKNIRNMMNLYDAKSF
jgi:hypothetical protein